MVKKIQVLVREVYEQEQMETRRLHNTTGEQIDGYDFNKLSDEEKAEYTVGQFPTGKMELLQADDNDPVYGQVFNEDDLDVKDLILHLNRTK